jgi:hypothetical protein
MFKAQWLIQNPETWWIYKVKQWQCTWLGVHRTEFPHTFEFLVDVDVFSVVVRGCGGSTTLAPCLHYLKLLNFECLSNSQNLVEFLMSRQW